MRKPRRDDIAAVEAILGTVDAADPLSSDRIVIFGAGTLGKKTLSGLRTLGLQPLAFCDNNQQLWNKPVDGLRVVSPADAASSFGDNALFVIATWHPCRGGAHQHYRQLGSLGCRRIVSFAEVFLKYPDIFTRHGLFEDPRELQNEASLIAAALDLFEGRDRDEFLRQLQLRFQGDLLRLSAAVSGPQYFPADLVRLTDREFFLDCGAYNGDTMRDFFNSSEGKFEKFIAAEPDPTNFLTLQSNVSDARVETSCVAVGSVRGKQAFHALGTTSSSVSAEGSSLVDCVTIDELVDGQRPSYIKMDIEGFELDALLGARETIRRSKPKLAVCAYHQADHLWRVPLLLKELQPDSTLHLRPHLADGYDLVCYSIPKRNPGS